MRAQLLEVDQPVTVKRKRVPTCQACGGEMKKAKASSVSAAGQIAGVIVFLFGLAITILIPIIGWGFGPLLMLLALFMGSKRSKVWRCRSCRSIVPRM